MDYQVLFSKTPKELEKELRKADLAYREGHPYLSDEIFDALLDRLREEDPNNSFLKEVGAPIIEEKMKSVLPYKMFSLDKIKNEEKPFQNWRNKHPNDILISDKLDGNSGLFYVKNGKFHLYTRGDGTVGQDISYLTRYISIFKEKRLEEFVKQHYPVLAVRGELILSKKDWESIQKKYPDLSNSRNTLAGSLNSKQLNLDIISKVQFIAYEWIAPGQYLPSDSFDFMRELGFNVVHSKLIKSKDVSIETLSEFLLERREISPFEIDGIVVSENKIHPRNEEGNPKNSFAFKSLVTQDQVEVVVTQVEWNVSKDGILKPLVHFPKVVLNGVQIQKATGKNAKFIEENVIGIGSKLIIIRAGDVIPDIIDVIKPSDSGKPDFPNIRYVWNDTRVEILIDETHLDSETEEKLELRRLIHFFTTLETEGFAEGVITRLYEAGYTTLLSLLQITSQELQKIEGFKKRSAEKLETAISQALERATPIKLMVASNQFQGGFGERKLKSILDVYPEIIDNKIRYMPTIFELLGIPGIAEITAEKFLENLPFFWEFVEENSLEFILTKKLAMKSVSKESNLSSKATTFLAHTFVFSGFRNSYYEELVQSSGGKIGSSVSKNTNYLIVKDSSEMSNKITKAKELGIPILTLEQFQKELI